VFATLLFSISVSGVATAEEEQPAPLSLSLTTGVLLPIVLETGDVIGSYLCVGPTLSAGFTKNWIGMAGLGFEVAPRTGNYGAVGFVGVEYLLADMIGLDFTVTLAQDVDEALIPLLGHAATANTSFGVGVSIFFSRTFAVSPMFAYSINMDGLGHSVYPAVFISVPIFTESETKGEKE
jgi:hypothetical protein